MADILLPNHDTFVCLFNNVSNSGTVNSNVTVKILEGTARLNWNLQDVTGLGDTSSTGENIPFSFIFLLVRLIQLCIHQDLHKKQLPLFHVSLDLVYV